MPEWRLVGQAKASHEGDMTPCPSDMAPNPLDATPNERDGASYGPKQAPYLVRAYAGLGRFGVMQASSDATSSVRSVV